MWTIDVPSSLCWNMYERKEWNGMAEDLIYYTFLQLWIVWPSYINKWLTAERSKFYKPIQQIPTLLAKIDGFFERPFYHV